MDKFARDLASEGGTISLWSNYRFIPHELRIKQILSTSNLIKMTLNYHQIYNHDYFNGKKSFFWRAGYGGYGWFSKKYFDNLYRPITPYFTNISRTAKVLDIGCAYGFMLERFPHTFQKYGIDVSQHAIDKAKQRLPGAKFKVIQAEDGFPFAKDYFDFIICNDVLEHLEKPELLLKNAFKVLKPKGLLYLTTPNLNLLRKTFFSYADKKEHHVSLFPHKKLLQTFESSGFKIFDHWTFFNLFFYLRCKSNCGIESAVVAKKV